MQIMIDIPDHIYNILKDDKSLISNVDYLVIVFKELIKKGTPLPKGHGRLVDADKLKTHFIGTEQGTDLEVYLEPTIINAPTIIKADKEN